MEAGPQPTSQFKLVFASVVAFSLVALLLDVLIAVFVHDSEPVRAVAETCATTYKLGFGAIVGLMGARKTDDHP